MQLLLLWLLRPLTLLPSSMPPFLMLWLHLLLLPLSMIEYNNGINLRISFFFSVQIKFTIMEQMSQLEMWLAIEMCSLLRIMFY